MRPEPSSTLEDIQERYLRDKNVFTLPVQKRALAPEITPLDRAAPAIDITGNPAQMDRAWLLPADICAEEVCLPWRSFGMTLVVAISTTTNTDRVRNLIRATWLGPIVFSFADAKALHSEITRCHGPALAAHASTLCPEKYACREWAGRLRPVMLVILIACLIGAITISPALFLSLLLGWIVVMNTATTAMRVVGIVTKPTELAPEPPPLPKTLPVVSILLPVLNESEIVVQLVKAVGQIRYPAHLLDVKLLLEAHDIVTRAALDATDLPPYVEVLDIPAGGPTTKPRAMNYALPFCKGSIVGIYDAEDHPDPDQVNLVVRTLAAAPPEVACLQAGLDFYNPRQNWLTRCFTMEYAIWFRVLLFGVRRLGIPLPLGGTSVFFHTKVLKEIGAWDAHNVTEDADLGMRLARLGYRCDLVRSITLEEANPHLGNWLRQRSRWLKGYAITWLNHMRNPVQLWRDLGTGPFLGFQLLLLGSVTAYLAMPLFWILLFCTISGLKPEWFNTVNASVWTLFFVSLPLGNITMVGAAILALKRRRILSMMPWALTLPFYWSLGAIASYRAIIELFTAPFHWQKTNHGLALSHVSDLETE